MHLFIKMNWNFACGDLTVNLAILRKICQKLAIQQRYYTRNYLSYLPPHLTIALEFQKSARHIVEQTHIFWRSHSSLRHCKLISPYGTKLYIEYMSDDTVVGYIKNYTLLIFSSHLSNWSTYLLSSEYRQ